LRALVYFDEIFGYLPPISNPPSKNPMLRMLKQARAFGVGLVLATQNPVDVDYKALSNAGTWFIGKLQTDQDKQRLLDGLQGAMPGYLDRSEYDRLISKLDKRVFLLKNVHQREPVFFRTRWAMNYLAGPLTRAQIPALNKLVNATLEPTATDTPTSQAAPAVPEPDISQKSSSQQETAQQGAMIGSTTRPTVPSSIDEYFLPNNLTFTTAFKAANRPYPEDAKSLGLLYRPVVLAQAHIRFLQRKYDLDHELELTAIGPEPDRRGFVRWENFISSSIALQGLEDQPDPRARFSALESPLSEAKTLKSLEKDFLDWAYRNSEVTVRANETLNVYAGPQVSSAEFRKLCTDAAREEYDEEIEKVAKSYDRKLQSLENKLSREERELSEDKTELSQRKMEELGTHAETFLSLFSKRRRSITTSLTKRRMTEKAEADVQESLEAIEDFNRQITELEQEADQEFEEIKQRWAEIANDISEIPVQPYKKDVLLDLFGVAWLPYHLVQIGQETVELPGFEPR
jgi:hypothetical protein